MRCRFDRVPTGVFCRCHARRHPGEQSRPVERKHPAPAPRAEFAGNAPGSRLAAIAKVYSRAVAQDFGDAAALAAPKAQEDLPAPVPKKVLAPFAQAVHVVPAPPAGAERVAV